MNQKLYSQLDHKKGRLDGFRPLPPELVTNLDEWFRVELTYTSNAIEGNTLTRSETALVVEKGITVKGKTLVEHLEAINHAHAIDYVKGLVGKRRQELTRGDILDIHSLVLQKINDTSAGRYREVDVELAGIDFELPNHLQVPNLMEDFLAWLTGDNSDHPVKVAADAHLKLVTIHPFIDGNGRTARLLMNLLLMQEGYPPALVRKEDRNDYIDSIGLAQQMNDSDFYYELIAQSVERSIDVYLKALNPEKDQRFRMPDNKKLLRIGELASLTGETAVSIRHWTDEGLLETAHLTDKGFRYYRPEDVEKVKEIRRLQNTERLSLPEIKMRFERATTNIGG
jgi:Fic family protein